MAKSVDTQNRVGMVMLPPEGGSTPSDKIPSAICTTVIRSTMPGLRMWLYSLSLWNGVALQNGHLHVFVLGDSYVCAELGRVASVCSWLHVIEGLESYSAFEEPQMMTLPATDAMLCAGGRPLWDQFQLEKATIMKIALSSTECSNVLYTSSNVVFLAPLRRIPVDTYDAILSPNFAQDSDSALYGHFNNGWIWVKNANVLDTWKQATCTSRFHEQAALEEIAKNYNCAALPITENFGRLRITHAPIPEAELRPHFASIDGVVCFRMVPITSVQTQIFCNDSDEIATFNTFVMTIVQASATTNPRMRALYEKYIGCIVPKY